MWESFEIQNFFSFKPKLVANEQPHVFECILFLLLYITGSSVKEMSTQSVFCKFPLPFEKKMSNRILNFPPNRPLPNGIQWKSVFGVFALEVDCNPIVVENKSISSNAKNKLEVLSKFDEERKLLFSSVLALHGMSTDLYRLDRHIPFVQCSECDRKILLKFRQAFIVRSLVNTACETFACSESPAMFACGSAIRRILDLGDYSLYSATESLLHGDSTLSIFSLWNSFKNELHALSYVYLAIAPDLLSLRIRFDTCFEFLIGADPSIDEYFSPSGWSGCCSEIHMVRLFNTLMHQFSNYRRILWSSSLPRFPFVDIHKFDCYKAKSLDTAFIRMIVSGHILKGLVNPLLNPLVQQLYSLQITSLTVDSSHETSRKLEDIWPSNLQSFETMISTVLQWSHPRVSSLILPTVCPDVRLMIKRAKELSRNYCLPTCDSEVEGLQKLLSFSEYMASFFQRKIVTLLHDWAKEVLQDQIIIDRKKMISITPHINIMPPSVDSPYSTINAEMVEVIEEDSFKETPLLVGTPEVDPDLLKQAIGNLKSLYAAKFLKVDTQKALFKWRTARINSLKQSRLELRNKLEVERSELLLLRIFKISNPDLYASKVTESTKLSTIEPTIEQEATLSNDMKVEQDDFISSEEIIDTPQHDPVNHAAAVIDFVEVNGIPQDDPDSVSVEVVEVANNLNNIISDESKNEGAVDIPTDITNNVIPADIAGNVIPADIADNISGENSELLVDGTTSVQLNTLNACNDECTPFISVGTSLLHPDLSWLQSEEKSLHVMSDYKNSMKSLAIYSGIVESTGLPGSCQFGPGFMTDSNVLMRCISMQCSAVNLASLYSIISQCAVLEEITAIENMCMLSADSDFLSRFCSQIFESCRSFPGRGSIWNTDILFHSFQHCIGEQPTRISFELSEHSEAQYLSPEWMCAGDGVYSLRVNYSCEFPLSTVISPVVMDCFSCMTVRCLEVSQLSELLRMVWLKMKTDRLQHSPVDSSALQGRGCLLLIQHIVRGLMAYLSEQIVLCKRTFRQSLISSVSRVGGLDSLVVAVKDYSKELMMAAMLECTDVNLKFSDDLVEVSGDLSVLLRSCRLALGCLLNNELLSFKSWFSDIQGQLTALTDNVAKCLVYNSHVHLTALLLFLKS